MSLTSAKAKHEAEQDEAIGELRRSVESGIAQLIRVREAAKKVGGKTWPEGLDEVVKLACDSEGVGLRVMRAGLEVSLYANVGLTLREVETK